MREALLLFMGAAAASAPPEQIHLALTEKPGSMRVTWATMVPGDGAGQVVYHQSGTGAKNSTVHGSQYSYNGDGFAGTLHTAVLDGLVTGARYTYVVTSASGASSRPLTFRYQHEASQISFLSYGDMGIRNSWGTVKMANADAATGNYDLFLNVGDTSYANDDGPYGNNSFVFDEHFRNLQPHAAAMPFMSVAGNHEAQYSFAPYIARLPMPKMSGASSALAPFYFSFDYGPAHFVGYSTEHPISAGSEQRAFLEADLAAANEPAARAKRPWIILFTHHPMYCSSVVTWKTRCTSEAIQFRSELEHLMVRTGVDIHMSGHNHQYERSFAVAGCDEDYKTGCEISTSTHNQQAPVYIVNGAGGDTEGMEPTWMPGFVVPFRAAHAHWFRTGYGRATLNATHLEWEFVYSGNWAVTHLNISTGGGAGRVVDRLMLTKDPAPERR